MLFQYAKINHHHSLARQKGVVIVVALFIVALVATMAYVMMARLERDTRRTTLLLRETQAELYAQGELAWAIDTLRNDWEKQKKGVLIDPTPIHSPIDNMNGYQISGAIYDIQGHFNLNNVTSSEGEADFKRLLKTIVPDLKEEKANEIVNAIFEWITPGVSRSANDTYYFELASPYRAAHRPMISASELRLVKGMSADLFNALKSYVVALPAGAPINVQSAEVPVLASLSDKMTLDAAKALVQLRSQAPFTSLDDFRNLDIIKNHPVHDSKIIVTSNYFLVETNVVIEKQHLVLYTLLERLPKEKKAQINILWQSKGTW